MTTALEVIEDALRAVYGTGDEEPIEPADSQRGIRVLNDMMAGFEAKDIDLDYTVVTGLTDTLTVVAGAIRGIKATLARELLSYYPSKNMEFIASKAKSGEEELLAIGFSIDESDFPDSLPIGSGNEGCEVGQEHFFPANDEIT